MEREGTEIGTIGAKDFFEMCAEIPVIGQRVSAAAMERGQR